MTTGLDNNTSFDCTIDTVRIFAFSNKWLITNALYNKDVLENATGQSINIYNYQNF